jgi:hypothetical protein
MSTAGRLLEEFLRAYRAAQTREQIDGETQTWGRPSPLHLHATAGLLAALRGAAGAGFWILQEPAVSFEPAALPALPLPDDQAGPATERCLVVPDLAAWRKERLPRLPDLAEGEAIGVCPDWTCEVLSHRTRKFDRQRKLPLYARAGVRQVWVIEPLVHSLEVHENQGGRLQIVSLSCEDEVLTAPPFAEAPIALGTLWAPRP